QFDEICDLLNRSFHQMGADKGLEFTIERSPNLPPAIVTDNKRLLQILKNLLSNAFKFTERGKVSLGVRMADRRNTFGTDTLNHADMVIAFSVTDTGIGIPAEKQRIIFEAFQQADGTTSRKYGGTGLGLSISREIARLLGGEIRVVSTPGVGSTFTLYLPRTFQAPAVENSRPAAKEIILTDVLAASREYEAVLEVADDRQEISPGERVVLIVEDDAPFARILLDTAHESGYKGVIATEGDSVLTLAHKYKPDAITLDIRLPDRDGWTILDRLKRDPKTRHIPIHVITVDDRDFQPRKLGAYAHLRKPVTREQLSESFKKITAFAQRKVKRLLVVENDDSQRAAIVELIGKEDVLTTAVLTAEEALDQLRENKFDCMVMDLRLPQMDGFELIERIQNDLGLLDLPIIIYTGKDLTEREIARLRMATDAIVIKEANSPERLLAETSFFLHRVESNLPEKQRRMLEQLLRRDPILEGRKVLIVDDDVRNIFALTSALESYKMVVLRAEDGREGIERLTQNPDIEVVLMDIMMPGMDGYETMQAIRKIDRFKNLPIIALTAKAMKADRDKCIEAGASDYISKPLDMDQLLSMLRVRLYGKKAAGA
ncbi:MAG: response regulator, partial [Blastocatellia bacterium]|nr:response regulator [Blastocatellia bacterium]